MTFAEAAEQLAALGRGHKDEASTALALAAWVLNGLAPAEAQVRCMVNDLGRQSA
jgi:hypothetical protein